jgi:hypothetical protein
MEMIAENSRLFEREWLTVLGTLCVTPMYNQELDVESTQYREQMGYELEGTGRLQSRAKVNSQLMWYCTHSKEHDIND